MNATQVRVIGYWHGGPGNDAYPIPVENSASDDQVERQLSVLEAVTWEAEVVQFKGMSICRLCSQTNGSQEYRCRNGMVIPFGLRHYIEEHKVLVPGLLKEV